MTKKKKLEIESRLISDLVADPNNARRHSERNIFAIKGSLRKFGQQKPIVVDGNGVVVAGNGTVAAALELGWTHIDVVQTTLTGREAKAFALADNRTAELAEWDDKQLSETLQELREFDFDIEAIGFSMDDIDEDPKEGLTGDDDVPAPPKIAKTKHGDLYVLGDHRLLCGDSTNSENVSRLLDGKKADFCFTSPPYLAMRDYGGSETELSKIIQFIKPEFCGFYAVNLGLSRKDNKILRYWDEYIQYAESVGLDLTSWNVWSRAGMGGSIANMSAMFPIEHEWILIFGGSKADINRTKKNKTAGEHNAVSNRQKDGTTKKQAPKIVQEFGRMGSVIECCYATGTQEFGHPAMFPVNLPHAYIEACSDPGESIYEPFCGAGTTLIACEKTGRRGFGMEIDPIYCDVIVKRWEDFTGKKATLVRSNGQG